MEFHRKKLANGLTILFEERDVNVTTVMLATKFGSLYESIEEKGIAHFMEHLAFKGTKRRSAFEIAFEIEKFGGVLNAFTDEEETAYHAKIPSEYIEKAMDVIFDIFFNPSYPEEELKKEANVICEEIKMYKDSPQRHVLNKIKECLYKAPFGLFTGGDEKSVLSIKKEQILKKHRELYSPKNSILCVVGNNSFDEIVRLAEKFSQNIDFNEILFPKIVKINEKKTEKRENVEQANIAIGFHIPFGNNKDIAIASVFSSILGDGMSSKLFTEVREKRGLAYAVKSFFEKGKNYAYLVIYIGTDKEKINEVIKICIEEFRKMKNLSEKELEDGKKQAMGNYDVESEASEVNALHLILSEINQKAEDYYKFKEIVKSISLEDIRKIADIKDYASFVLS